MKKFILMIAVFILATTMVLPAPVSVDAATCQISNSSTDDGNLFASCSRSSRLRIRNTSWADIFMDTNTTSFSGGNTVVSGEDGVNLNITTGNATATTEIGGSDPGDPPGVDVNSTLIGLGGGGSSSSTDQTVLIDNVHVDDGNAAAVASESDTETITNTLGSVDVEMHDNTAGTGGNTVAATDDLTGVTVSTGVATTSLTKSIVMNFFQLLRNFSL